jgi:hypothetical protein
MFLNNLITNTFLICHAKEIDLNQLLPLELQTPLEHSNQEI